MGRDRAIGKAGALPWRVPEDLKRFKALTTGHAVIMGRKTFESIGRPLPNRRNLVVTRGGTHLPDGVEACSSLQEAIARARHTDPEPMVIGGEQIYREALPLATHLHLTAIDQQVEGCDAFFPAFDDASFVLASREDGTTEGVAFLLYERA
jgi:dihydrofolate reductase